MDGLTGCAICGAAMLDVELHAEFHHDTDEHVKLLHHVDSTLDEVERKAEYATNVLYQRGLD